MTEPTVIPMLSYADGPAAMNWLSTAFGFVETKRWLTPDGVLAHGEMQAGGGLIMLATPTQAYEGPTRHRAHCRSADAWLSCAYVVDGVLVRVDDVEAHLARARAAGAGVLSEIEDSPAGRAYRAEDLEGHRWMFLQTGETG